VAAFARGLAGYAPAAARIITAGQYAARTGARSGCYQSPQPFHPHITLLRDAGQAVAIPPPGFHWAFPVKEFALYESVFAQGRTATRRYSAGRWATP
jgi:2'-5' RNA ligase